MEITSKRHPYKFYLTLILCNIVLTIFASFLLIKSLELNNGKYGLGTLFIFGIAISITIGFIKNASNFVLNTKGLFFKNIFYPWEDLTTVKLTGKGDMVFTTGECATLIFKDNKKIEIFDDFYSNISDIKCYIQKNVVDKNEQTEISTEKQSFIDINQEFFIPYKGNPVFSFRGIMTWGVILFFILIPFFSKKPNNSTGLTFISLISLIWFLLNSRAMYFFEISENFFIIRNHYYFWVKDIYNISDIREVVYNRQHKQPNNLRIISKDFNTKTYFAGSLTDKTWLEMKQELESKNISVRNHCIPEN